ncbi:hypothetical protein Asp14428_69600 [Actinoplanes sp. NBRC 14428]|uniref:Secreted protein n=2 Tax=Pseudosporangium ferrugineum TaxID=439699 RepID=A0A2T0RC14_9ACTN|nr:hypothetical protein CLV70_14514 [Pseudosporangium ferrugineum]BCJ55485.1 hypothetical protein Asp14428_69600 [Actinoplanes sp. NBRC 14428]
MLLDLDGVLNPFGATTCPDGYLEREFYPGEGPERYCPAHGAWIKELAAAGDLHWATAWGEDANTLFAPVLGVGPFPVVPFPPLPFPPEDKVPAIARAAGDRPAAWIDDNHTAAGRRWAAGRSAPTLLVPVDSALGWTRADVDRVLAWAGEL